MGTACSTVFTEEEVCRSRGLLSHSELPLLATLHHALTSFHPLRTQLGIIPRVIRDVFERLGQRVEAGTVRAHALRVQFLELYGEVRGRRLSCMRAPSSPPALAAGNPRPARPCERAKQADEHPRVPRR